jgi:serine kinase of HPr protein (carbohydrate metabolism regulator)
MAEIHAGCVVIGEAGVLIRGASDSGKSRLARRLIAGAQARGLFARFVADDRVALFLAGDRLIGRPNWAIAGKMEVRGLGIAAAPHEDAAVIRLVVDCVENTPPRLPEDAEQTVIIEGIALPRVFSRQGNSEPVWIMLGLTDLTIQDE